MFQALYDSIFLKSTSTSIQNKNKLITPFCTFALLHVHCFADKISRPLVISSGTNWHTFSLFRPFSSLNISTSGHFCSSQQTQTLNCLLPLWYFWARMSATYLLIKFVSKQCKFDRPRFKRMNNFPKLKSTVQNMPLSKISRNTCPRGPINSRWIAALQTVSKCVKTLENNFQLASHQLSATIAQNHKVKQKNKLYISNQ